MRSKTAGKRTLKPEVTHISEHGIWLLCLGKEHFLPFDDFPWFKKAPIGKIHKVELFHGHHLHWPELDIDLELESLENPEKYPLVYS